MPNAEIDTPWAAVVLAAGRGKRMGGGRSKVLREVAGRPMVAWVVEAARRAGAETVVAVVGHDREAVIEALPAGTEWAVQETPRGTGDAVRAAASSLPHRPGGVWVLCGDVPGIRAETLARMAAHHRDAGAACTVLTMELDDPGRYGRIVRGEGGRVQRIVEFADANETERALREVNTGTYAFGGADLFDALPRLSNDNAQKEYYLTDVVGLLLAEGKTVAALRTDDARECMGGDTPEALEAIRAAWPARAE
jgi:bifunctional UDP-N-acetylglucosamine pyrophosphorylase/glucosamine-1-phosphate N-acetyltransferase